MDNASRLVPLEGVSGLVIDDFSELCDGKTNSFALAQKPKSFFGIVYNSTLKFTDFEQGEASLAISFTAYKGDGLYALYFV